VSGPKRDQPTRIVRQDGFSQGVTGFLLDRRDRLPTQEAVACGLGPDRLDSPEQPEVESPHIP